VIQIRSIQEKDNQGVAKMIRDVFEEFDARQKGTVYSDPTTDELYTLFQKEKSTCYVIENHGEILGCCGIYPTENLPEQCVELVKFYISSKLRGQGYGSRLINRCAEDAKKLGYATMYIESMDDFAKAVSIYERLGFERLSNPLGNSGHFGCDIWMLKQL